MSSIPLITGSPGVYIREEDISQQDIPVTTGIGVLVFAANKGSTDPVLVTSATSFSKKYGKSDLSIGFGTLEGLAFLAGGVNPNNPNPTALWALRVTNTDAKHAGATVLNTLGGALGNPASEGTGLINPYPVGTYNNYTSNNRNTFSLIFTEALATGASISGTINQGTTPFAFGPIAYTSNHAATMNALVAAINVVLATIPAGILGQALGVAEVLFNDPTLNTIVIYGPEGNNITATATLTGQVGNTATLSATNNLFDIVVQDPGVWGNDIGINITNINIGTRQRIQLTFSDALIATDKVDLTFTVNNTTIVVPSVTYATSNDASLVLVASAIQTAITNAVVTAIIPAGSTGISARQISIVAPNAGIGVVKLVSGVVSVGASPATISSAETFSGHGSNNTFTLNVWQRGNITNPAESFNVSLEPQLDGFGNQVFIEDVVNTSAYKSQVIRVRANPAAIAGGGGIDAAFAASFATIVWLGGGDNGSLPTNSQLINAWNRFQDVETYHINILINAGYTDISLQQNMALLGINRMDCMAILDMPSNMQQVDDAITYRTTQLNIDTSYAATYLSDIQVLDTDNDQKIFAPPSGFVAARYVYTDNKFATWWAPAGVDRGLLPTALDVRVRYSKPDRDQLDPVQLNALRLAKDGSGIVIWGDKTMQVTPSLLSAVNVRRLMIFVENTIARSLERNLFDQNSAQLAFLVKQRIQNFLDPIVGDGIKKYLVLADASNNPGYFGDAGQFNVSVYIVPIRAVRTILLDAIITPSTISFSELIISGIF